MRTTSRRIGSGRPFASGRLKYQEVKNHLLRQIADGELKPGDALPPERTLATSLGIAVHTVRHALSELSQEKIIQRVQGKGTFVEAKQPSHHPQKLAVFALIVPEVVGTLYPSLIKGFIGASAESHHQVLVCNTHMDTHVQGDMILQLINKNLAGAAIVPTISPMPAYQFDMLRSHGIPVVFCHRRPSGLDAPLITWPWKEVGRRAGEAIIACGHRCVAFVAGGPYVVSDTYLEAFRETLAEEGMELPDRRVLIHSPDDDVHPMLAEMLQAPDRPTAIFCNDAFEAECVFLEAIRLGLQVPQDLSIVGFGCARRDGVLSQRLTAVTIDEVDLGRRAATLVGQIQTGQKSLSSEDNVLVPLSFSEGQSLSVAPRESLPAESAET